MKLDFLVIAAHPDDAELGCGGTILKLISLNKKIGILDLTKGELGTRGNAEIRDQEASKASQILGISVRENLGFRDGFFTNDEVHKLKLIHAIRKYKPDIIFAPALSDRHPDHSNAAILVRDACFLSGLPKINTENIDAWRPKLLLHYIQNNYRQPTFVIDITPFFEKKIEAIKAYSSQFHNAQSTEPQTFISQNYFLNFVEARARSVGNTISTEFGEGFESENPLPLAFLIQKFS